MRFAHSFKAVGLMLCAAIFGLAAACEDDRKSDSSAATPPVPILADIDVDARIPVGTFTLVDARRASEVAAPPGNPATTAIGQVMHFGPGPSVRAAGLGCDDGSIVVSEQKLDVLRDDPMLGDLQIVPTDNAADGGRYRGDRRQNIGFDVYCEDELFARLLKVDQRVMVMPVANGSLNMVLERPLSSLQIRTYQARLKSMKFYDAPLTGEWDKKTSRAHRAWYTYRADRDFMRMESIPQRPAITENLLDGLGVLNP